MKAEQLSFTDPSFVLIELPQGSKVTLDHLFNHCSWRYKMVKRLLGLTSISKELMRQMIQQIFEDHGISWRDEPDNKTYHDWYLTITRKMASHGGKNANRRRLKDPNQKVLRLGIKGSRRKRPQGKVAKKAGRTRKSVKKNRYKKK